MKSCPDNHVGAAMASSHLESREAERVLQTSEPNLNAYGAYVYLNTSYSNFFSF